MIALYQAIYDRLQSTSLASALHWGMATAEATEAVGSMPYAVLRPGGGFSPDYESDGQTLEPRMMQISVFAVNLRTAAELLQEVEAALVGQQLSLAAGSLLLCTKGSDDLMLDPDRSAKGEEVWQGILGLEFLVQRAPGEG